MCCVAPRSGAGTTDTMTCNILLHCHHCMVFFLKKKKVHNSLDWKYHEYGQCQQYLPVSLG